MEILCQAPNGHLFRTTSEMCGEAKIIGLFVFGKSPIYLSVEETEGYLPECREKQLPTTNVWKYIWMHIGTINMLSKKHELPRLKGTYFAKDKIVRIESDKFSFRKIKGGETAKIRYLGYFIPDKQNQAIKCREKTADR